MFPAVGAYAGLNAQLANCVRIMPHLQVFAEPGLTLARLF
jgi:hypothetical protein